MDIYMHISSGSGPKECEWVVVKLAKQFAKEAKAEGLIADILWEGEPKEQLPSVVLKVSGPSVGAFVADRIGSTKWVGESPFRPIHKRKNWFVSVKRAPSVADVPTLNERDVTFQTMRASGPGGQHVNTTDSAVRATHLPTELSVVAREERSQHANRKLALIKLAIILDQQRAVEAASVKKAMWQQNHQLERGNERRTYVGSRFKLKRRQ